MCSDLLTQLSLVIQQQQDTISEQDRLITLLMDELSKFMSEEELKEVEINGRRGN